MFIGQHNGKYLFVGLNQLGEWDIGCSENIIYKSKGTTVYKDNGTIDYFFMNIYVMPSFDNNNLDIDDIIYWYNNFGPAIDILSKKIKSIATLLENPFLLEKAFWAEEQIEKQVKYYIEHNI